MDAYSAYASATGCDPIPQDDTDHALPAGAVSLWGKRRISPPKAVLNGMTWDMPSGTLSTGAARLEDN
jgi:hypothetical protein